MSENNDFCSEDCAQKLSDFKKNQNLISIEVYCTYCGEPYSVPYSVKKYANEINDWICSNCYKKKVRVEESINRFGLNFPDKEKYHIYKTYGIEALSKCTGDSEDETRRFVGSYFEKCCTSMGNNCLYFNYLEEANVAKKIDMTDKLVQKLMHDFSTLRDDIEDYLPFITRTILNNAQQEQVDNEYTLIKEAIETLIKDFDEYLIATADCDLKRDQQVYLQINGDYLIADPENKNGIEYFCMENAEKGKLVAVCESPHFESYYEIWNTFEDFKDELEEMSGSTFFKRLKELNLSNFEQKIISTIIENDGCFQNQLWKDLDIDSRKCSRIVKRLADKDLITKEHAVSNGARTYKLDIND